MFEGVEGEGNVVISQKVYLDLKLVSQILYVYNEFKIHF